MIMRFMRKSTESQLVGSSTRFPPSGRFARSLAELPRSQADKDRRPSRGVVHYRAWLTGVICWDGLLPMCILTAPQAALALGANRDQTEFLAVSMPVLAFFVRIFVGGRRIASNHCGPILRSLQFAVFFLAAVLLVCIDTCMLIMMELNNGRIWATAADLFVWLALLSVYFLAMLFALYPGRSPSGDLSALAALRGDV